MHRILAIVERELRRFKRSPMLIVMSMIMPLVQLVVLGYAFVSVALAGTVNAMLGAYNLPATAARIPGQATLDVVEVYPYVPYVQYLLPGSICMSIFMMVMIGGGIIFIDDKARGLHEGYLVTPITKLELIAGFNVSGTIKAVLAGFVLMTLGAVVAGIPDPFA